jgi:hypothetical protein
MNGLDSRLRIPVIPAQAGTHLPRWRERTDVVHPSHGRRPSGFPARVMNGLDSRLCIPVIPAQAGTQLPRRRERTDVVHPSHGRRPSGFPARVMNGLDSRLRGNDGGARE